MKFCVFIVLIFCVSCRLNYTDKNHLKQGKWKVYYDDSKKHLMYMGRFKDHKQTGKWRYFNGAGLLYLKEKYIGNGMVQTVYYYPNGKRELEGLAQYVSSVDTSYYRWEGDWKKYDSTGVLMNIAFYKCGKLVWYNKLK